MGGGGGGGSFMNIKLLSLGSKMYSKKFFYNCYNLLIHTINFIICLLKGIKALIGPNVLFRP